MRRILTSVVFGSVGLLVSSCASEPDLIERADRIFRSGVVITVDSNDRVAEAVAIKGGRLLALGTDGEVMVHRGEDTEVVDLQGRAVLPGFIDSHGSFLNASLVAPMVDLSAPPLGSVGSVADLQEALRSRLAERRPAEGTWLLGYGFDKAVWDEVRYPTRAELDAVSTAHPVLVVSVTGEVAVANSLALRRAGIHAETADPPGGRIGRDPSTGKPNGLLEGAAMAARFETLQLPSLSEARELIEQTQEHYLAAGITTVQEGGLSRRGLRALIRAAEDDVLQIDVVSYPKSSDIDVMIPEGVRYGQYYKHFRFGGVQLKVDGPLIERMAWLREPYEQAPDYTGADFRGGPRLDEARIDRLVEGFYGRDLQLLVVADGDAATSQVLGSIEKAIAQHGRADRRTVLAGLQPVTDDQLARMARLGVVPSFPASHTYYWGDWLRDTVLGADRAARVSPARSALRRRLRLTLHDNTPEVPPDILQLLASAVTRTTRSGAVLGNDQRIAVMDAIRAVTIHGASAYFEEDRKGSIEVGKLADLVILSHNPLTTDPAELATIEVVETIKDGVTVYTRPGPADGTR